MTTLHPPGRQPAAPLIPSLPVPTTLDPLLHTVRKLAAVDIIVDDFLGAAQGSASQLRRIRRILFTAIDDMFRPLDALDHAARHDPISLLSKLMKGDACSTMRKKILGWILLDTLAMTLTPRVVPLASRRCSTTFHETKSVCPKINDTRLFGLWQLLYLACLASTQ